MPPTVALQEESTFAIDATGELRTTVRQYTATYLGTQACFAFYQLGQAEGFGGGQLTIDLQTGTAVLGRNIDTPTNPSSSVHYANLKQRSSRHWRGPQAQISRADAVVPRADTGGIDLRFLAAPPHQQTRWD